MDDCNSSLNYERQYQAGGPSHFYHDVAFRQSPRIEGDTLTMSNSRSGKRDRCNVTVVSFETSTSSQRGNHIAVFELYHTAMAMRVDRPAW